MFLFKHIRRSWLPPTGRMHACIVFRGLRPVLNLSFMRDSGEAPRTLAGQSRTDIFPHAARSDNSSRFHNSGANWRFAPGRRSARACLFNPKTAKVGVFKKILLSSICSYLSVTGEAGFRRRAACTHASFLGPVACPEFEFDARFRRGTENPCRTVAREWNSLPSCAQPDNSSRFRASGTSWRFAPGPRSRLASPRSGRRPPAPTDCRSEVRRGR